MNNCRYRQAGNREEARSSRTAGCSNEHGAIAPEFRFGCRGTRVNHHGGLVDLTHFAIDQAIATMRNRYAEALLPGGTADAAIAAGLHFSRSPRRPRDAFESTPIGDQPVQGPAGPFPERWQAVVTLTT